MSENKKGTNHPNGNGNKNIGSIISSIRNVMREDAGVNGDGQRLEQLSWLIFLKLLDANEAEYELDYDGYTSPVPEHLRWRTWAEASDKDKLTGAELIAFIDTELFPALRRLRTADQPDEVSSSIAETLRVLFTDVNNYMKNGVVLAKVINLLNQIDFNNQAQRHLFNDFYEQMLRELQSAGSYGEFYTPRPLTNFIVEQVNPVFGEIVLDPACGTGGFLVSAVEHLREQDLTTDQELDLELYLRGTEWKTLPYALASINLRLHLLTRPLIVKDDAFSRPLSSYTSEDRVHCIVANPPFGGTMDASMYNNFSTQYKTKETADLFLVLIIELLRNGGRAGIVLPDGSLSGEGIKSRIRQRLLEECNLHTIVRLDNSVFKPYASVKTNLLFFTKGEPTKEVWYFQNPLPEGVKGYSKTKPMQDKDFDLLRAWWHNRQENENAWRVPIADIAARGYDLDIKHPNAVQEEILEEPAVLIARIERDLGELVGLVGKMKAF